MDAEKVLEVIGRYRAYFAQAGIEAIDFPHNQAIDSPEKGLAHCHGMLRKMEQFVREGRLEKAFRWLGFVQSVLWLNGIFTLEELKNHNRPPES